LLRSSPHTPPPRPGSVSRRPTGAPRRWRSTPWPTTWAPVSSGGSVVWSTMSSAGRARYFSPHPSPCWQLLWPFACATCPPPPAPEPIRSKGTGHRSTLLLGSTSGAHPDPVGGLHPLVLALGVTAVGHRCGRLAPATLPSGTGGNVHPLVWVITDEGLVEKLGSRHVQIPVHREVLFSRGSKRPG